MEPNYQSIVITNAIGLVLLFGLVVSSNMARERRHLEDRIFSLLVAVCAGGCVFEPITWFVDGIVEPWAFALNYLGNTYCYVVSCFCPYLWILYVDARLHKGVNHIQRWHPVFLAAVSIIAAMDIVNLFGHFMFTIDDANVYSRQPLSYISYVTMIVMFIYSGWMKHDYQRKHGQVRFFPIVMFLAPVFAGALVQALMFGISIAWPSVCIGLVSIHMSLQNELSYIDPLTNLYNRTFLSSALTTLERSGNRFGGIMIDLDHFKDVNDSLGHSVGDEALAEAALILVDTAGDKAIVVRYAGDEFLVFAADADEERAERMKKSIAEAVDAYNATSGKPYKLQFSMGSSVFSPGVDTIDDFLRRIDERMYEQKHQHHKEAEAARTLDARSASPTG